MNQSLNVLALDLGAESGRAILGIYNGQKLNLKEIHRFTNRPINLPDGLHWDALGLFTEIKNSFISAKSKIRKPLVSAGIDTWGVDFGLLDRQGSLIGNPYHYRDSRCDGMLEEAFKRIPRETIFQQTGTQFLPFNSLFQLLSMVLSRSPQLDIAETFLTMPDLFNYWLTGQKSSEFTIATTTQCYNPRQKNWASSMLKNLNIPPHIFPEIIQPGSIIGELLPKLAEEINLKLKIIAPACHDTGSAVTAVPAHSQDFLFISSGTWSLLGTEIEEPIINAKSLKNGYTNEGAASQNFRFLKNISGLWLIQECRRTWADASLPYSYDQLIALAATSPPFLSFINPDSPEFLKPGDMPTRIQNYCRNTNQLVPQTPAAVTRCILESLAFCYRLAIEQLENITGSQFNSIFMVGGGTKNKLLNQFAANSTRRVVIAGPIEATAVGNILVQLLALGEISNLDEGRELVRRSFDLEEYVPENITEWEVAYQSFLKVYHSKK